MATSGRRDEPSPEGLNEANRVDRYLWAIRLCKTRALATSLCRSGHVKIAGASVKASHAVRRGDRIVITIGSQTRDIEVVDVIASRVGAALAAGYFIDRSPPEPVRTMAPLVHESASGRPTKRDRRQLDRLRGRH